MKKTGIIILLLLFTVLFSSCEKSNIENVNIDLGNSDIYSRQELQAAADKISNEIKGWNSVKEVYSISYCGDETAIEELNYCNTLKDKEYTQCVVFESSFETAGSAESDGFNSNSRYDGWQWYLARTDNGEWEMLTWGY